MSKYRIVFSPKARDRLLELADYLYRQKLSNRFVTDYLDQFEHWLEAVLGQFPEAGTPMPQFGQDVRRIVYQRYSFLYRLRDNRIEILTVYRENLP